MNQSGCAMLVRRHEVAGTYLGWVCWVRALLRPLNKPTCRNREHEEHSHSRGGTAVYGLLRQ